MATAELEILREDLDTYRTKLGDLREELAVVEVEKHAAQDKVGEL